MVKEYFFTIFSKEAFRHIEDACDNLAKRFSDTNPKIFNEFPKTMKTSVNCSSGHLGDNFHIPVEKFPQQSEKKFAQNPELAE